MAKVSQWGHGFGPFDLRAVVAGWDYLSLAQTATTDAWTYKMGGASGQVLATLTITYTDSTKATISSVAVS